MGKKGIPHRKWSKEEKLKIIHLHLDEHMSLLKIEKEYGIRNGLVCTWVKKYLEEGEDALEPHNGNPYAALHTSKSLSEVERLRLMVAKLEVENARLKKGYWVKGVGANKEYVTASKISCGLSLPDHGCQPIWLLQMAKTKRNTQPLRKGSHPFDRVAVRST